MFQIGTLLLLLFKDREKESVWSQISTILFLDVVEINWIPSNRDFWYFSYNLFSKEPCSFLLPGRNSIKHLLSDPRYTFCKKQSKGFIFIGLEFFNVSIIFGLIFSFQHTQGFTNKSVKFFIGKSAKFSTLQHLPCNWKLEAVPGRTVWSAHSYFSNRGQVAVKGILCYQNENSSG